MIAIPSTLRSTLISLAIVVQVTLTLAGPAAWHGVDVKVAFRVDLLR